MHILKQIVSYSIWSIIALLLAFVYIRIVLGAQQESSTVFMAMFSWLYEYTFVYIGVIIASTITFLFILIDVFYLNKKLKNSKVPIIFRFFIIVTISILVSVTHYMLEKVIDII
jgi:hypothetical protein